MEVVLAIVGKIGEYTVAPVGRQIGYVFYYKSNMVELDSKIKQLEHKKERLQRSVGEARRKGEEIEADVEEWLDNRAHGVTEEATNILRDHECRANTRCLNVSFPNLVWRHRLSRKAKKMVESIASEIQVAVGFDRVSYLPTLQSSIRNEGYEEFGSRMSTLKMVMEALRDPNVNMIGLYGMGGVGKTMLAKEVARKTTEEKLFSQAIVVTVSQNPNYESMQQEIADWLGLQFHEKSLSVRAERLRSRLTQEKMLLIIVDDVWEKIDLDGRVGISFGGDQKQCKILLTSRFHDVLFKDMGIEKISEVGKLSESESMDLFNKIAGDSAGKPGFRDLASQIVEECDGLPLALTVVASALREESCPVWRNALHELQMSSPNNIRGMHEKVYKSVKLSYDFLRTEEAKSLLLLCSLFPEDANIRTDELLIYAFGLDLFQGIIHNLKAAKNKMFTLVNNLKRSCLLLDGSDGKDRVKLHDVIRDVAIEIASKEKRWYNIRNLVELDEYMRDHKKFKDANAISLLSCTNVVEQLPQRLEGPQLQLLLIGEPYKGRYFQIADRFFETLKELRVLVLNEVNLNPLPSSFPLLQNLRTLRLFGCKLGNIALIGELKNLEILDLSRSRKVVELGSEIRQLTRLRVLDLGGCDKLEVIQPNVLGSLRNLEWLKISSSFTKWEFEGVNGRERRNASLSELKNLPQLSSLNVTIRDVNVIPKDFFGEKLESYSISVARENFMTVRVPFVCYRKLKMDLERSSQVDELGLGNLLKRSDVIQLYGLEGMKSVAYELDTEGFPLCRHLVVANNAGILYIVNSDGQTPLSPAFPILETLDLQRLVKLEKICHGRLASDSFRNLRRLEVSECHRLKSIFCFSIAKLLEVIVVESCEMIEEIVDNDEAINAKIEFPHLRLLCLEELPQLLQYCSDHQPKSPTSTSSVTLFNEKVEFSNLEMLYLTKLNIRKVWSDQLQYYQKTLVDQGAFGNLSRIIVSRCDNLKALIPSSLATSLVHLDYLSIEECKAMEEIVYSTEESGKEIRLENMLFPKLRILYLMSIPSLKRFCPSLVRMRDCEKMGTIIRDFKSTRIDNEVEGIDSVAYKQPLFNSKVEFPNMEQLNLESLSLQIIWDMQLLEKFDNNLTGVTVKKCHNLKSLIPSSLCGSLVHLKWLEIRECENIREVVSISIEESAGQEKLGKILFPQLQSLQLYDLPKLERFCAGDCIECPSLKEIDIRNCGKMETFISYSLPSHINNGNQEMKSVNKPLFIIDKVEFPNMEELNLESLSLQIIWDRQLLEKLDNNLTRVTVKKCYNLKSLIPSSLCGSLVHLKWLKIRECENIREVVSISIEESAGQEKLGKILFPQLQSLQLYDLPKLQRFCAGDCIECPSLKEIDIRNCGKMETFISYSLPSHIDNGNEEMESVNKPLFIKDKVEFPNMEELNLESLSLQIIWDMQLLKKFDNNLTRVTVNKCHNLKSLIPSSLCGRLVHLESLEIRECENIREVVSISIEESAGQKKLGKVLFPQLQSLQLFFLPKLKRFCAGDCIECPSLKQLNINYCGKMETFISYSLPSHIDNGNEEMESINKQPLFIKDKVKFPNLEELRIYKNEVISEIWHSDQSSTLPFPKLKIIELDSIDSESYIFSLKFVQRLEHLEHIIICSLFMESLISSDEAQDILMPLRSLDLAALTNLMHLCDKSVQTCKTFQVVEVLKVSNCDRLKSLITSSMSFQNLTTLRVSFCYALENLMASAAAAKSLQQLTEMTVSNCKRMTQIIGTNHEAECDVETEQNVIWFSNLKILKLHDLCSLGKFYSGKNIIRLPNLEKLTVIKCPEMRTFSHGTVCTPMLQRIMIKLLKDDWRIMYPEIKISDDDGEYQELLEGDVNTTVQKLWEDHQAATPSQHNVTWYV